jgi:hypothetical protein
VRFYASTGASPRVAPTDLIVTSKFAQSEQAPACWRTLSLLAHRVVLPLRIKSADFRAKQALIEPRALSLAVVGAQARCDAGHDQAISRLLSFITALDCGFCFVMWPAAAHPALLQNAGNTPRRWPNCRISRVA